MILYSTPGLFLGANMFVPSEFMSPGLFLGANMFVPSENSSIVLLL